jgi:hypothetical protein
MDWSDDPTEKPKSPTRGAAEFVGSVIGFVIGLDPTAASGFATRVASLGVWTAVTSETFGVFL